MWDNASWHKSKELKKHLGEGNLFENITLIQLPPYAPEHNPVEHVWNNAKEAIANIQRETSDLTFGAFESHIRSRMFEYDFEHLPIDASGPVLFNCGYEHQQGRMNSVLK